MSAWRRATFSCERMATSSMQGICALALLACSGAAAPEARTAPAGPAPEFRRGQLARAIGDTAATIVSAAQRDSAFPGAYLVIGDSRGVLFTGSVGRLDWAASPEPTDETLWDLASLTKVIVPTTLAAQLTEQNALDLDSPVQRYLPGWTGPGKDRVTIRHLLTHTSGLPAFRPYDQQTKDPDSLASLLFNTELERAPGERMVYSDIGAFVLGRVIERVGGERLDILAETRIFRPLRLRHTMFRPPTHLRSRIAPTEIDTLRGGLVRGVVHDERAYYLGGVAAHAGLFGSASDLTRFAVMMLRGGALDGVRILHEETVARFTRYADSSTTNRALGWQKPEHAGMRDRVPSSAWAGSGMTSSAFGHTGFTGTSIAIDPALDVFIILLSNRVNPTRNNPRITPVRRALADAVTGVLREFRTTNINGLPR